jgi:hypothetical protein
MKAQQVAQISSRPIYVFRELMAYLTRQRLIAPGYTVMQEMIGDVLQREKERLIAIAKFHLTDDTVTALNDLLANPRGLYEITRIKREPKDFSIKEINEEIRRGEQIKPLYAVAQTVLPHLEISNESIKYYASLINYYSVFQMSQLGENLAHIYLLCFVHAWPRSVSTSTGWSTIAISTRPDRYSNCFPMTRLPARRHLPMCGQKRLPFSRRPNWLK